MITRGNEGVLDARLQDAEFSFDKDLEAGLDALDRRLDAIVFHKRLGSMAAKRDRLVAGVGEIAAAVGADPQTRATAERAAALAKADQGAVLVAEFSELEGYVAAEYARRAGVPEEVAQAVEEHYLPEGAGSPLPATDAGALLAAAERIDNLVGAFAVDEAPTGSKDPYGLRRAALGLVRIALARGWDLRPAPLLEAAHARLSAQGADLVLAADETAGRIGDFLEDRFVYLLGERGRRRRGRERGDRRGGGRSHHHGRVGARHPGGPRRGAVHRRLDRQHPAQPPRAQGSRRRRGDRPRGRPRRGRAARRPSRRPPRRSTPPRSAATSRPRWPRPSRWPRRWTASSWTCSSTPTTRGCGPGGTRLCGMRPGSCPRSRISNG